MVDYSQIGGWVALLISLLTAWWTYRSRQDEIHVSRQKVDVDSGKTKVDADVQFRDDLMQEVNSLRADIKLLQTANGELTRQNALLEGRVERQNGQIEHLTEQVRVQGEANGQLRLQLDTEVQTRKQRDQRILQLQTQLAAEIQTREGCDQRITELQAQLDVLKEGSGI